MTFELLIAGRYLKAKRSQSFISLITVLSVAGVAVGVMALVVVIAVMTGAESDFKNRILSFQSHISIMKYGEKFTDHRFAKSIIDENPHVIDSAPFVYSQVMLRSAYGVSGAVMRGIDPTVTQEVVSGYDTDALQDALGNKETPEVSIKIPGVIMGADLAMNLGVSKGDLIYIISPKGMISPIGHVPSMRQYRISGVFKSGMYEYDSAFIFLHVDEAQNIMRMGNAVSGIDVWVDKSDHASGIKEQLTASLGVMFTGRDWIHLNASLFAALKLEKIAMFVILALIVMVAAFNIASSLIMMVMEKTKDIAILKTMGASNNNIMKVFVWLGTIIGFVGTFAGVSLGIILCMILERWQFIELPAIYAFSSLPIQLEIQDVAAIALASMAICFFSTLYPSYQASRLQPVEAIRYG